MQPIANEIGDELLTLATRRRRKVDLAKWHFIGFLLGAHMAGLISRRIKQRLYNQIIISYLSNRIVLEGDYYLLASSDDDLISDLGWGLYLKGVELFSNKTIIMTDNSYQFL